MENLFLREKIDFLLKKLIRHGRVILDTIRFGPAARPVGQTGREITCARLHDFTHQRHFAPKRPRWQRLPQLCALVWPSQMAAAAAKPRKDEWRAGRASAVNALREIGATFGLETLQCRPSNAQMTQYWCELCEAADPAHHDDRKATRGELGLRCPLQCWQPHSFDSHRSQRILQRRKNSFNIEEGTCRSTGNCATTRNKIGLI